LPNIGLGFSNAKQFACPMSRKTIKTATDFNFIVQS